MSGNIIITQFPNGAIGKNLERLLDECLVGPIAGNQEIDVFGRPHETESVDGESADDNIGDPYLTATTRTVGSVTGPSSPEGSSGVSAA